jgi:hypothetical protein
MKTGKINWTALMAGVALAALTAGMASAGPRASLQPWNVPDAGGIVLVAGNGEGAEGGGDAVAPGEDDPTMWAGGDPDFCEACGGEVVDPELGDPMNSDGFVDGGEGGEGEVADGGEVVDPGELGPDEAGITSVDDGEPVAMEDGEAVPEMATTTGVLDSRGGRIGREPTGAAEQRRECLVAVWRAKPADCN